MQASASVWLVDCLTSVCLFPCGTPTNPAALVLVTSLTTLYRYALAVMTIHWTRNAKWLSMPERRIARLLPVSNSSAVKTDR